MHIILCVCLNILLWTTDEQIITFNSKLTFEAKKEIGRDREKSVVVSPITTCKAFFSLETLKRNDKRNCGIFENFIIQTANCCSESKNVLVA